MFVQEQNLAIVADENELEKLCKDAIAQNEKAVDDYKKGEQKALQFLIGQAMKETRGSANPQVLSKLFKELIK